MLVSQYKEGESLNIDLFLDMEKMPFGKEKKEVSVFDELLSRLDQSRKVKRGWSELTIDRTNQYVDLDEGDNEDRQGVRIHDFNKIPMSERDLYKKARRFGDYVIEDTSSFGHEPAENDLNNTVVEILREMTEKKG